MFVALTENQQENNIAPQIDSWVAKKIWFLDNHQNLTNDTKT